MNDVDTAPPSRPASPDPAQGSPLKVNRDFVFLAVFSALTFTFAVLAALAFTPGPTPRRSAEGTIRIARDPSLLGAPAAEHGPYAERRNGQSHAPSRSGLDTANDERYRARFRAGPSPDAGDAYDAWLAGGASAAPPDPAFLARYLAGLEERFFNGAPEADREAIVAEVERLRRAHGDNASFTASAGKFLTAAYFDAILR